MIIIATPDELRALTKQERNVYELYRIEGVKKEDICERLGISMETFLCHWRRANKKIERTRDMMENPLEKLQDGVDVFNGKGSGVGTIASEIITPTVYRAHVERDGEEPQERTIDVKAVFDAAEKRR